MKQEVTATIGRLIAAAQRDEASERRSDLFDRYMGEPYGDEQTGKSKFVSTDVSDAVEAILPDILDLFMSAEGIAEFSPTGPEDEEAAKQETEVVEHVFWQKNPGFENLTVWLKEALIQQNAYIRRGWDDRERVEIEEYEGLSEDELLVIYLEKQKKGIECEYSDIEQTDDGINVRMRCVSREKRYVIQCIPQEEFFITPQWNRIGLEGVLCHGQRREMETGELLRMGFSEESVKEAGKDTQEHQTSSRFDTDDVSETEDDEGDESTKPVTVHEAYCRVDIDDDGKAEMVRAWAIGDGSTLLKWKDGKDAVEEVSCSPFSALTPYLVPHRHVGRSVSELVEDIQRVKSILIRHGLDNIYATNYARPHFDENMASQHTYEDLANPAHGAPVRTGGAVVTYERPPTVLDAVMPLLEKFDDLKEARTGATRYNQGLDADSLNKTASGIKQIMNATQKKTLLIARTFAETGIRDLFLGIHRDLRAGPMKELAIKLRGGWTKVHPRVWADRTDMTIKIGQNSREQRREGLMMLKLITSELAAAGSRLVSERGVFNLAQKLMETFGFKSVDEFLEDPEKLPPPQPPPPDPNIAIATKQLQIAEKGLDGQIEKARGDLQAKMEELAIKKAEGQRKAIETAADIRADKEKLDLDRKKAVMADDLARDQAKTEEESAVAYSEV